jgi:hypothetical protein
VACGDDDNTVRLRPDAGGDAATSADAGPGTACGVTVPEAYDAPAYAQNAAVELAARAAFDAFTQPMKDIENAFADGGTPDAGPTQTQLAALFAAGSPSVRTITTDSFQGRVDAWLQDYEAAVTAGVYAPADPPPAKGGLLGKYVINARGIDLRQAVEKGLYNAAFYNHAVKLVTAGPLTEATVDRLVAAFGAHPTFPNNPNATANKDVNAAGYAARRDGKDPASPGPYQRAKRALLVAKAAIAAGDKCNADRDVALRAFFLAWEKSQYATVVYYFKDIEKKLAASPVDGAAVLHAHSEGIGFIAGFRTIDPAYRKITDAQVDAMLAKSYAASGAPAEAYKVLTATDASSKLESVITDIKGVYGFTDAEMLGFEKNN